MRLSTHVHVRKRAQRGLEPYPARRMTFRLLDAVVLTAGILGPLMTIPQILKIFAFQQAAGVSFITWLMYACFDAPWIAYGIAHRDKTILTSYILWFLMNTSVCVGVLLYGGASL